ncbi:hypothetical protein V8C34DRAFT_267852 [Trichoderma compactum]
MTYCTCTSKSSCSTYQGCSGGQFSRIAKVGSPELAPLRPLSDASVGHIQVWEGARGVSVMGIVLMRNLRLDDAVRSALSKAPQKQLHHASTTLKPLIVGNNRRSRKKLKRGADSRANEIYLGARKRGPPNLRPSAGRLHRSWAPELLDSTSKLFESLPLRRGTQVIERAWGPEVFARRRVAWVHHQDLPRVGSMPFEAIAKYHWSPRFFPWGRGVLEGVYTCRRLMAAIGGRFKADELGFCPGSLTNCVL